MSDLLDLAHDKYPLLISHRCNNDGLLGVLVARISATKAQRHEVSPRYTFAMGQLDVQTIQ